MSNNSYKVGIVSYKNTLPLLYGLNQLAQQHDITIVKHHPAELVKAFDSNVVDIALLPVAYLKEHPHTNIIGHHCISSREKVASVCLFSQVPLQQIETVLLDFQSRTSVQLVQLLFKHFWKKEVNFQPANEHFITEIKNNTAAVIIGDRAFEYAHQFNYCYDLAEAWYQWHGLPFVFACWMSRLTLPQEFLLQFEAANQLGLSHLESIAQDANYTHYNLYNYYTQNIAYTMDTERQKSLELFLKYLND
jgi:chorismate dehydratase